MKDFEIRELLEKLDEKKSWLVHLKHQLKTTFNVCETSIEEIEKIDAELEKVQKAIKDLINGLYY